MSFDGGQNTLKLSEFFLSSGYINPKKKENATRSEG